MGKTPPADPAGSGADERGTGNAHDRDMAGTGSTDGTTNRATARDGLARITVNLTPRAAQALDQAVKLTGDSKTDTINRALLVHAYFEDVMQNGGTCYTQAAGETELVRLHFF